MASEARSIPRKTRERLLYEAGGICANPGCGNSRVEIHHIQQWAIYKSHDSSHMIAVCPTCHDACHSGNLKISDDVLYLWKGLPIERDYAEGNIFVPSAHVTKLSMGTITLQKDNKGDIFVFNISNQNQLQFSEKNGYLRVSAKLTDEAGHTILEVTDNNIKVHLDKDANLEQRPGIFKVTVPTRKLYLPAHALYQMRQVKPDYGQDDSIIALELEVMKAGQVRVQGFWPKGNGALVVTKEAIHVCHASDFRRPLPHHPVPIVGDGDGSILVFSGPVNGTMFNF
ncbi:HNH endonuclease [Pseudomonas sp. PDM27]|uniref:HNH endonuclease n=1 Tax=Pseudomonas sp. PDM27 TaxID=2854769 RepID=UPI001C43C7EC|nr:HNH endonuclease signature motif containing protein [Pseudomonas sp. PDM27]MBV7569649.1 HNH endonuclease [Pseudomonas sp. PDM27]